MTPLLIPDVLPAPAALPLAGPSLRLRRGGEVVCRDIPLAPGKCTIGSSSQCQVHLPSPDVRPLQCLITLQDNAAQATRWGAGVRLNGHDFSQAVLVPGDVLTVGSWEIEFCGGDQSSDAAPASDQRRLEVEASTVDDVEAQLTTLESAQTQLAEVDAPEIGPSQTAAVAAAEPASNFQDKLVLHLWTANHSARRRAKSLINGIRAARFHAEAMAADLSAMETELDLARAAYDSHLGHDEHVQSQATRQQSEQAELFDLLQAQIADLQRQLAHAQQSIVQQTEAYEQAIAVALAAKPAPQDPAVHAALEQRIAELEAALAARVGELASLTSDFEVAQDQRQQLAELHRAEVERAAALETGLKQVQSIPTSAVAGPNRLPLIETTLAAPAADVWASVPQLSDVEQPAPSSPSTWQTFAPASEDDCVAQSAAAASQAVVAETVGTTNGLPLDVPPVLADTLSTDADERKASQGETRGTDDRFQTAAGEGQETPAWAPAEEPAAPAYSSTSFIDKYRHLLEDDGEPAKPANGLRAVIDDEFLSPAKVEACASGSEESDEALEAYMANMMRRVRSTSSSMGPASQAIVSEAMAAFKQQNSQPDTRHEAPPQRPPADFLSEEPLSFEDLKQATRKVPLARDLSALREIANSSARGAIATHSQRQTRESAISKIVVAGTAMVTAAYLMASAPEVSNWQFWVGVATCAVGITAAVQVLIIERRGRA